jgi:hypothetical protein
MCLMEEGKEQKDQKREHKRRLVIAVALHSSPIHQFSFSLFSRFPSKVASTRFKLSSSSKMADSVDEQPGDVRSLSYRHSYIVLNLSTGRSCVSEVNLGPVHQIVSIYIAAHCRSSPIFSPQHRIFLWRSLFPNRPTIHSLPCLSHRVPWCARLTCQLV